MEREEFKQAGEDEGKRGLLQLRTFILTWNIFRLLFYTFNFAVQTKYSGMWPTYFGISDQQHSFRFQTQMAMKWRESRGKI